MQQQRFYRSSRCWSGWVIRGTSLFLAVFLTMSFVVRTTVYGAEELNRYEFLQIRMGIPVNITLYAPTQVIANQASRAAYDRFREIDRMMSDYDPDSELMQLCKTAKIGVPNKVSPELFEVLKAANALSIKTDGAFDVTVGQVVKLWRIARRRKRLPDEVRLKVALAKVGYNSVQLNECKMSVILLKEKMQIDLGAIAKGYAADEAREAMEKQGVTCVLIDAGGDIVAGDPPPKRDYWRIEVEKLRRKKDETAPARIVKLKNAAIATSGDAYRYVEFNGTRYSHIVNPQTGLGLTTPSTVTIIASTGLQADSLASAVSVLGPERGVQLINTLDDAEALVFTSDEDGTVHESSSNHFRDFFIKHDRNLRIE